MLKFFKKLICVSMAFCLVMPYVACGNKTKAVDTTEESASHYVTNGLHKITVDETDREFIKNGKTDYEIIVSTDAEDLKAAYFIQTQIKNATGVQIPLKNYSPSVVWSESDRYIVFDVPQLFTAAKLNMPSDNLYSTGYYIKSAGDSVFLVPNSANAAQYAALAFLRQVIGYEMYSEDIVVYTKSAETLPDIEIIEKPDFEFMLASNRESDETCYGMGFLHTQDVFIPVGSKTYHNVLTYLPLEEYYEEHSGWYSTNKKDLCYTARGDESEFNLMAETIAQKIIELSDQMQGVDNITVSVEDNNDEPCQCVSCVQSREKYGGADSAGVIKLCNAINRIVQQHLEEKAERENTPKRNFNILFFAYRKMEQAPAKKVNGVWVPYDDTVILDDNVGVYIAPASANYMHSFYDEVNQAEKEMIESWSALGNLIYMWLYETNFSYYFYPYNSYESMIESYRFCKANNAIFMLSLGQYNANVVTCFGRFKEYLNSKAMFDVNSNYAEIVDGFFTNYFREAAEPMLKYFNQLQAYMRYLENAYPEEITGDIYDEIEKDKFWPYKTLVNWLALTDEAFEAIEIYKDKDPQMYAVLYENIKIETLFMRFALLRLHEGKFSQQEYRQMQLEFKADCEYFNLSSWRENSSGNLKALWQEWGI